MKTGVRHNTEYVKDILLKNNLILIGDYNGSHNKLYAKCIKCEYIIYRLYKTFTNNYSCNNCNGTYKHNHNFIKTKYAENNIKLLSQYKDNKTKNKLECLDCGNIWYSCYKNLHNNHGCPSCIESLFEKNTKKIIEQLTNKRFLKIKPQWLINPKTNKTLELDLYNEELKIAIEVQGDQHYRYNTFFHKTIDDFKNRQYIDELKRVKCREQNIKLIEVKYNEKDIEKCLKDQLHNYCVV